MIVRVGIATVVMTVDVVGIFHLSQTSATIVLRAAATLLVAKVLPGTWSEESFKRVETSAWGGEAPR